MLSYRTQHHPSSPADVRLHSGLEVPLEKPSSTGKSIPPLEPGLSFDGTATLHVRARRRLSGLELQTQGPLQLLHNGQVICLLNPGESRFEPPLPLEIGDVLTLQLVEPTGGHHG
jgi:hypothetical protein